VKGNREKDATPLALHRGRLLATEKLSAHDEEEGPYVGGGLGSGSRDTSSRRVWLLAKVRGCQGRLVHCEEGLRKDLAADGTLAEAQGEFSRK